MCIQFSDQLVIDLEKELDKLRPLQGVVGLDRGYRYRGGKRQESLCWRVFLDGPKVPAGQLDPRHDVARLLGRHPAEVDVLDLAAFDFPREGVPPKLAARLDPVASQRLNPIQPGISVSHLGQGAGTLGLLAYRGEERFVLSCAHVIAGQFARRSDPIFQPGVLDRGDPDFDTIGYLEDWFVDRDGDAAIAVLNRARMFLREQFTTEQQLSKAGAVRVGDLVEKSGRGSGVTQALVDGIGLYLTSLSGFAPMWISGFRLVPRSVSRSTEISRAGDSGAVWYRSNGVTEGVGLHIDGETPRSGQRRTEYAIACHLTKVLERFRLNLSPPEEPRAVLEPFEEGKGVPTIDTWMAQLPSIAEMMFALVNGTVSSPLIQRKEGQGPSSIPEGS
jgi:hypothetical protein